ncbi:MAG: hypothetical protein KatS3mg014_0336 [Actinomycetota bacterium]|nr:MAG: hypothetical protein KatS3mg014_0336 [Actinomycetota bacterium]
MTELLRGELKKVRRWRLFQGTLVLLVGALILVAWRNQVSLGVQEDVVAGLDGQLEELKSAGVSGDELAAYEGEAALLRSGLSRARQLVRLDGSLEMVSGILLTAPGMLVGLVIGAGLVGLELAGPRRTVLLAGVGRSRLALALVLSLGALSLGLAILSAIVASAANAGFSWVYHRPIGAVHVDLASAWAFAAGAAGLWFWALVGALAAALTHSPLGGILAAGAFVGIDSIVARGVHGIGRFLIGPNILVLARSSSRTASTALLIPRVWFESWGDGFPFLGALAASGVLMAFALSASALLTWLWNEEDVIP